MFLMIPILNLPIVNGIVLRVATNVMLDTPIYLLKKTAGGLWSLFHGRKEFSQDIEMDDRALERMVIAITRDTQFPDWENIEVL